jgi:hypothetical protein
MIEIIEQVKKVVKELTPTQVLAAIKKLKRNSLKTELTEGLTLEKLHELRIKHGRITEVSLDELFYSKLKEDIMLRFIDGQKPSQIIAYIKKNKYELSGSCVYNYETEYKESLKISG